MDYNPELEKAEAELQEQFRREGKTGSPHAKWTDAVIFFAAAMHFLAAVILVLMFLALPVFMVGIRGAGRLLFVWIGSLPSAGVSLGVACALERVVNPTSPAPAGDPNNMPPMPVQ
jgi:hypothetical protein